MYKIIAMSDLHLSKKPWQIRKALLMCRDADMVLLAGDLTNDGKPEQMEAMHQHIAELLPETPVLAVSGNHDYPIQPLPLVLSGIDDYPSMQNWLLKRQPYPYEQDASGAWAVSLGDMEIIGLNAATHWRRFKFPGGAQIDWLKEHLEQSKASRHIILCHAPLLAHNPKRSDKQPYLSRDKQLQLIVNAHQNILFISGHTHISMRGAVSCVEFDKERNNIFLNDGSVRPTTLLNEKGKPLGTADDENIVELLITEESIKITGVSVKDKTILFTETYPWKEVQQ